MGEYIEDRISSLENRVGDIERHYNFLNTRVNDIGTGVAENNTAIIKTMREVEKLKCEVRGTEYLDPLTDKPIDQSTEEFVKVKHGYWFVDIYKSGDDRCECSECCYKQLRQTNYCPNCGAKMENAKK